VPPGYQRKASHTIEKMTNFCYNDLNSSQKMQKKYQCRYGFGTEAMFQKRRVWFAEVKKNEKETAEEPKKPAGVAAIEAFKNKNAKEAREQVDKETKTGKDIIEKNLNNWLGNKLSFFNRSLNYGNKAALEQAVNELARKRVRETAEKLQVRSDWIKKRADGSLAVKNAKVTILDEQVQELSKMISESEQDKIRLEEARSALSVLRRIRMPFSDDLQRKISRLEDMRKMALELKEETEGGSERKENAFQEIRNIDSQLRGIVLNKDPLLAGEIDRVIRGEILRDTNLAGGGLERFLKDNKNRLNLTSIEEKTCREMLKYLKNGSFRANISGTRSGTFSKRDVENYYISQYVERGELNREDDNLTKRLDRLKDLPLGQAVGIFGEGRFHVLEKPNQQHNGYMLKRANTFAFIDISDKDHPLLTIEEKDGTYKTVELTIEKKGSSSLEEVEFGVKKAAAERVIESSPEEEEEKRTSFMGELTGKITPLFGEQLSKAA